MNKIAILVIFLLLNGCATSAQDRRMRDSGDSDSDIAKNIGIGLAVFAMVAAASNASAGTGSYASAPIVDYSWAWDLQRGSNGALVWVCRGIQSGQYAQQSKCQYKWQNDSQWPGY